MSDAPILPDDEPASTPSRRTMPGRTTPHGERLRAGDVLLGRYTVLSEPGEGGMGVVYKCLDSVGGIEVAIKCLPPELSRNEAEMEGIRENYGLVAKLHHSAISGLRNLEKDPDFGEYYLVMDLAEGEDLSALLRRRHGAPMSLAEALAILRPLAAALDYAHGEKILHRDVKPGNVKVLPAAGPGGAPRVQLLDFGLAAEVRSSLSRVSRKGYLGSSGTPAYMAPEQWEARPQGPATDQYALAVVAYQMLAGVRPFDAGDPDVLRRAVLSREPESLTGAPRAAANALSGVLRKALSKSPENRFASCSDFCQALSKAGKPDFIADVSGRRMAAKRESGAPISGDGRSGFRWIWGLAGGLVGMLVCVPLLVDAFSDAELANQGRADMVQRFERLSDELERLRKADGETVGRESGFRERIAELESSLDDQTSRFVRATNALDEAQSALKKSRERIASLESECARLERVGLEKDDALQADKEENERLGQTIQELQVECDRLKERIRNLLLAGSSSGGARSVSQKENPPSATTHVIKGTMTPGVKGRVAAVNREFNFLMVELSDEAVAEIMSNGEFNPVDLMVHRKTADGGDMIVTRVRLAGPPPDAERMTVGECLYGWEQVPPEVGDVLVY